MNFIKNIILIALIGCIGFAAGLALWARQPILTEGEAIPFTIKAGSGLGSSAQQIVDAGVPINAMLFNLLVRSTFKASKIKAGSYELKPDTTPLGLIAQLVRGQYAQEALVIIEGWTFKQMRQAIAKHPALKHDTVDLSEQELLKKVESEFQAAEGLFFPDTYLFAKGASELDIYKQAHAAMVKHLLAVWTQRDVTLPYRTPYDALIMASIIEKETGQPSERGMIASVFVNRLRLGMLLQTDPTVIYGMGDQFQGNIRKRDLETDTPYNTYVRTGLPPTPIALPGLASINAALALDKSDAVYFVARGNGTSHFSTNLNDHNRAVNKYQR